MGTQPSSTLSKGLRILRAIASDEGRSSLSAIAAQEGIPLATAHRFARTLQEEGFLSPLSKGHYALGSAMRAMPRTLPGIGETIARLRAPLANLASRYGAFAHFGNLESGMVTYLIKENGTDTELFTREQEQQEAYCSAIGKILLAALPEKELDSYLEDGPFIALTRRTITRPQDIRRELETVRLNGVAYDRHEIRDDLFCMGVPVMDGKGAVMGAISVSFLSCTPDAQMQTRLRRALRRVAEKGRHAPSP